MGNGLHGNYAQIIENLLQLNYLGSRYVGTC